jgi:hypothetical protein
VVPRLSVCSCRLAENLKSSSVFVDGNVVACERELLEGFSRCDALSFND